MKNCWTWRPHRRSGIWHEAGGDSGRPLVGGSLSVLGAFAETGEEQYESVY
jgi:hypothetical protein